MISEQGFEEFLLQVPDRHQKYYCCYRGIKRKEHPRWAGWAYIDELRGTVSVSDINSEYLDLLVQNFFLVEYLHDSLV